MSLVGQLLLELRGRAASALAFALVIAAATAVVVVATALLVASELETRRIQRDAGLNVVLLPAETRLEQYWRDGHATGSFSDAVLEQLEDQAVANRLMPMVKARLEVGASEWLVVGIGDEIFKGGKRMKPAFGLGLGAEDVTLGSELARRGGYAPGDEVAIAGRSLRVARVLSPAGSIDDVTAWVALETGQALLGLEGRLNEIQALECHCGEDVEDPLALLQAQLESRLPGTQVLRRSRLADARRGQRLLATRALNVATPVTALLAGLVVAGLAWLNVRERRGELALLSALGHGAGRIGGLVLARAVLLGGAGGVLGVWVGERIGSAVVTEVLGRSTTASLEGSPISFASGLVGAVGLAAAASLVPAALATVRDPARDLSES